MSSPHPKAFDAADFAGRVRLFPLPNLVLFPQVLQPLHIFEPRYRRLMEDALAGDHLIAMVLYAPGWERSTDQQPAIHQVACLGRIATYRRLPDGRFNLLLEGARRIRIHQELPLARPYREAEVELIDDVYPTASGEEARLQELQCQLIEGLESNVAHVPELQEQLGQLATRKRQLGVLADLVAYAVDFPLEFKQELLAEARVVDRAERLIERLRSTNMDACARLSRMAPFPPPFSSN